MTAARHGRTGTGRYGGPFGRFLAAVALKATAAARLLATIMAIGWLQISPSLGQAAPPSDATPSAPAGQTVCIQCSGPDASYACRVTDTSAGAGDAGLRLYCITEIARTRHHASCAAARVTTTPCAGDEVVLAAGGASTVSPHPDANNAPIDGGDSTAASGGTVAPPPGTMVSDDPQLGPPPKDAATASDNANADAADNGGSDKADNDSDAGGPSGVEKAVDSAGKALNSAGQAVSNTAKKGWSCVTSFFSDC